MAKRTAKKTTRATPKGTVKVPAMSEWEQIELPDGSPGISFAYPSVKDDGGYRSTLGAEFVDKPVAEAKAEARQRYLDWQKARNPDPPTDEELQQRALDLNRQLLDFQNQLNDTNLELLNRGVTPDIPIVVPPIPDLPPVDEEEVQ